MSSPQDEPMEDVTLVETLSFDQKSDLVIAAVAMPRALSPEFRRLTEEDPKLAMTIITRAVVATAEQHRRERHN